MARSAVARGYSSALALSEIGTPNNRSSTRRPICAPQVPRALYSDSPYGRFVRGRGVRF